MKKLIGAAVDVETTGLSTVKHEICEIGIVIFDTDTFQPTGMSFNTYIRPTHPSLVDQRAMDIHKIPMSTLRDAPTQMQVISKLLEWKLELFDDALLYPLGHNYNFDGRFLRAMLDETYSKIFYSAHRDSQHILRGLLDAGMIDWERTGMDYVKKQLELDKKYKAHSALDDAMCSLEIYRRCLNKLRAEPQVQKQP